MRLFDRIRAYLNEDEPADVEISGDTDTEPLTEHRRKSVRAKRRGRRKENTPERMAFEQEDAESGGLVAAGVRTSAENEIKTVQDFCEQLIDVAGHMEEAKREYRIVTEYLTDIQRIEELPADMANELVATAQKIDVLDRNRQTYLQSENLLSLEQYNTLAALEDETTDTIRRLNEMEQRDSMLKSDMGHLEGEKESLRYMRTEYARRIERLRGIIISILVIFLLTSAILLGYAMLTRKSVTLAALVTGAIAMLVFAVTYVRYVDLKNDIRDADIKVNRAISLLNKVKVKYINNTNTLDYIYEKYDVNSSKELEYRWEQYNTMVRDAKKYYQANSDLRAYNDALTAMLDRIGVVDSMVWIKQVGALIDRREMVEIKHGLNVRRQKLRERMATCEKIRDNACIALRAAVTENPGMMRLITELLSPHKINID